MRTGALAAATCVVGRGFVCPRGERDRERYQQHKCGAQVGRDVGRHAVRARAAADGSGRGELVDHDSLGRIGMAYVRL